jgi:hypothetical protein
MALLVDALAVCGMAAASVLVAAYVKYAER